MDKSKSPFIIVMPTLVAALLFFAGAYRFYQHFDNLASGLYILAGIIFLAVGFINYGKLKK